MHVSWDIWYLLRSSIQQFIGVILNVASRLDSYSKYGYWEGLHPGQNYPEKGSSSTRRYLYSLLGSSLKSVCQSSPGVFPDFIAPITTLFTAFGSLLLQMLHCYSTVCTISAILGPMMNFCKCFNSFSVLQGVASCSHFIISHRMDSGTTTCPVGVIPHPLGSKFAPSISIN